MKNYYVNKCIAIKLIKVNAAFNCTEGSTNYEREKHLIKFIIHSKISSPSTISFKLSNSNNPEPLVSELTSSFISL